MGDFELTIVSLELNDVDNERDELDVLDDGDGVGAGVGDGNCERHSLAYLYRVLVVLRAFSVGFRTNFDFFRSASFSRTPT